MTRGGPSRKDLAGKVFGRLTAVRPVARGRRGWRWEYQCSCGAVIIHDTTIITNGRVRSCGCLKREMLRARHQRSADCLDALAANGEANCLTCGLMAKAADFCRGRPICKPCGSRDKRDRRLESSYGISREQFDEMVRRQEGRCAICLAPPRRLMVDHCHATGRVRGLLCTNCNAGIGMLGEDTERMQSAIGYVARGGVA